MGLLVVNGSGDTLVVDIGDVIKGRVVGVKYGAWALKNGHGKGFRKEPDVVEPDAFLVVDNG